MDQSERDELTPPKPNKLDTADSLVQIGIAAIPILGAPARELFNLVITPPLEKRRIEWMNTVAQRIHELEGKVSGFTLARLKDDQMFITTIMEASAIALRNHHEAKLEALRNAVVNCAAGIKREEDVQLLFLNIIDALTPLHLRILAYFHEPEKWLGPLTASGKFNIVMGGASTGLETAIPELSEHREIYDPIVQDLYNHGLLFRDKETIHVGISRRSMGESSTTELGKRFTRYISPQ